MTLSASTLKRLARIGLAAGLLGLPGASGVWTKAQAGGSLEQRKLPMAFTWYDAGDRGASPCPSTCQGFVAAVGSITADTIDAFEEFAAGRDLKGATIVLDSSGGSVLDAIDLGRQWRRLGVHTTVGLVATDRKGQGPVVAPEAYCESMCVFLLLAGKTRAVPPGAHVRVHQIWMGDRADDATRASYTAQDVMIIERDVGRLAKYTFEMGGTGDLLGLALSVPPWEPLHELSPAELQLTNLVEAPVVAEQAPARGSKPIQDRLATSKLPDVAPAALEGAGAMGRTPDKAEPRSTRTAEAHPPGN